MKKRNRFLIYPLIIMGVVLMFAIGCKKKKEEAPSLSTTPVTEITITAATSGGLIISEGSSAISDRGVCWSTTASPTTADSKVSGTSAVNFTAAITGLTGGTLYHVRAYATNSVGTGYGDDLTFTTLPLEVPVVTTTAISALVDKTATSGGNVTSDGGSAVTARGVCWSTGLTPTTADSKTSDGTGTGTFTSSIIGLTPETTYNVRAYATNAAGTGYGAAVPFTTTQLVTVGAPSLTTAAITVFTDTTATAGGTITSEGSSAVTVRGVCWSTGTTPTIADSKTTEGSGTGTFTSEMTGLLSGTTYYVRAYATNGSGTGYGPAVSFTTVEGPITDFDGNVYHKVTIGTQVWLVESLQSLHYQNGDEVINITDGNTWGAQETGAWCYYNNDQATSAVRGILYNYFAPTDPRHLGPTGYRLPTNAEVDTLISFLGGITVAGGPLKQTGTTYWTAPNEGATNSTGFTAIPSGFRDAYAGGTFNALGEKAYFWTSTISDVDGYPLYFDVFNTDATINKETGTPRYGFLVRLIKGTK